MSARLSVELREELDRFLHAQLVRQGSGLQNRADLLLELLAGFLGIESADARDAAIRRAHPFQNFDGGCFARAIRPEQAEHFAFLDGKADAAQRFHGAVALVEILDLDDWFAHGINPLVSEEVSIINAMAARISAASHVFFARFPGRSRTARRFFFLAGASHRASCRCALPSIVTPSVSSSRRCKLACGSGMSKPPARADHAVPGNSAAARACRHRVTNDARAAGQPKRARELSVGGHAPARDFLHQAVDRFPGHRHLSLRPRRKMRSGRLATRRADSASK